MRDAPPLHIAVAIPCYNSVDWIERTVTSVFDQGYAPLTVILVDDGSSDGSAAKVRSLGGDVIVEEGPNRGACAARNTGFEIARSKGADYILFLDADDYLEGDMLAGAAHVAAQTGADMVMSNMHIEYEDGQRNERFLYSGEVLAAEFFEGWMETRYVNPSGLLWRMDLVEKVGGWDESLARAQDIDITLRAMLLEPKVWKNDDGAAIHAQVNAGSISRNVSYKATDSRLRVQERLLSQINGTAFERFAPLLCREIYSIARSAFQSGETELGRRATALLQAQNYTTHPGTRAHKLVASVLGLETKVRLWGR